MKPEFRIAYNAYVAERWRHWLGQARMARLTKNNGRFWYCMGLVRRQRERFMWPA